MNNPIAVSDIVLYPIKGISGIHLKSAEISVGGLRVTRFGHTIHDREFVVVDERGEFVSQRGVGKVGVGIRSLSLVNCEITPMGMILRAPEMEEVIWPHATIGEEPQIIRLWGKEMQAMHIDDKGFFTKFLSREKPGTYRLMANRSERKSKNNGALVDFADGYPLLMISEASLAGLNKRIAGIPVPMNRFRPNIVITGCEAHDEDRYASVRVGEIFLKGRKLCDRCPMPNIDQATGEWDKRVLKTLMSYRCIQPDSKKIWFGRNFDHVRYGSLKIGDELTVLGADSPAFA